MKKIVLTGGGTAGHVNPNIALLPSLRSAQFEVSYIGSYSGIEKELIEAQDIPYYGIDSGKLRRYLDLKNLSDPFRVLHGFFQAKSLLRRLSPDVIFSKGGFVSVPVVLAAKSLGIPAVIHESDLSVGLANRIASRGAQKLCCTFPETLASLPKDKAVLTGTPIRRELTQGDAAAGRAFLGFDDTLPILLVVGGSLGSAYINNTLRAALDSLLADWQICHLCGKGHLDPALEGKVGYRQYEYVSEELPDLFAASSLVLSRAGANALCEILALRLPNILIPLSAASSRGDQLLNARSFEQQGFSFVMEEEETTPERLVLAISEVSSQADQYRAAMEKSGQPDAIGAIVRLLVDIAAG